MATDKYSELKKNTVDSRNQMKESSYIKITNPDGKGRRVMFMGNSITLHGINEGIGWHGEWGMAASKEENDYVHILMNKFREVDPDVAFCICQVSRWEMDYLNGSERHNQYESAREFGADVIVARFIENCPHKDFDGEIFKKEYESFIDYINIKGNARIVLTTGFYPHPGDEVVLEIAQERNYPCVTIGDLGAMDEMKAIGKFEHEGVANHPGDLGMRTIAERIWREIK